MKKTIIFTLCVIFSINSFAQIPPLVEVTEFEVKDQAKAFALMNTWKGLEKDMVENAPRIFLLSEMDGNTIYFCRAFNTMKEITDYRESRWGENGWKCVVLGRRYIGTKRTLASRPKILFYDAIWSKHYHEPSLCFLRTTSVCCHARKVTEERQCSWRDTKTLKNVTSS